MTSTRFSSIVMSLIPLALSCLPLACGEARDTQQSETKIKNGSLFKAEDKLYRPLVSLFTAVGDGSAKMCTGTILAPHWVLTAAHCVSSKTLTFTYVTAYKDSRHKPLATYRVREVVLPSGVTMDNNGTYFNGGEAGFAVPKVDVALLRLDRDMTLDGSLVAARLPNILDASAISGLEGYAIGAGSHDDEVNEEQTLKWASSTITDYDFANDRLTASHSVTNEGDSGGPFLTLNSIDNKPVVWGVLSLTRGISIFASDEYTDVGLKHRLWIETTILR